jgi:hypothetical protein
MTEARPLCRLRGGRSSDRCAPASSHPRPSLPTTPQGQIAPALLAAECGYRLAADRSAGPRCANTRPLAPGSVPRGRMRGNGIARVALNREEDCSWIG